MDDIVLQLRNAGHIYLAENQVFEITGKAVQTLRNDRCKGVGIPYYKVGRSVRYRLDHVLAFMEAHRVEVDNT